MEANGSSAVLCNKADCNHKNEGCAAYLLKTDKTEGIRYGGYLNMIYFHKGKVYVMYNDDSESGRVYLEEIAGDGSYRNRLFEIGDCNAAYVTGEDETTAAISKCSDNRLYI